MIVVFFLHIVEPYRKTELNIQTMSPSVIFLYNNVKEKKNKIIINRGC